MSFGGFGALDIGRCPNMADFGYNFTFRTRPLVTYYCRRHVLRLICDAGIFPNYTDINITPAKEDDYGLRPGMRLP